MSGAAVGVSRETMKSLAIAGAIMTAWVVVHFAAIFGAPVAQWSPPVLVVVVLAQTWLSAGLFITAHDCMHGSLAPGKPALNRAIGRTALMIYAGLDFDRMTPAHFAHHRHVGTADDPDFHIGAPHAAGRWFVRFFANYYTHVQLVRITVVACLYMVLGASLLNIAIFWAVPALLALGQLFFFGTFLPHRHRDTAFADHHRARSVGPGGLLSLLSCFHFGGYHHEHHLAPHAPWWRLPAMRLANRG
jgi:beta-carotene/zeaxanthin 4-ketolase